MVEGARGVASVLLLLAWLSGVVLPFALYGTRVRPASERWLGVAVFWSASGLLFALVALSGARSGGALPDLEGACLGALEAGLALLVGFQATLWQPRGDAQAELRRLAWLSPAGLCLAAAASFGSLEALTWSELSGVQSRFEAWRAESALVVPPGLAFGVTYAGLWGVLAALWPFRRSAEEVGPDSSPDTSLAAGSDPAAG